MACRALKSRFLGMKNTVLLMKTVFCYQLSWPIGHFWTRLIMVSTLFNKYQGEVSGYEYPKPFCCRYSIACFVAGQHKQCLRRH